MIYISGPITNNENFIEDFEKAEEVLIKLGFRVLNPAKLGDLINKELSWFEYMKIDLYLLSLCDRICMLEGWENSKGARIEHEYAKRNNIEILYGYEVYRCVAVYPPCQ